MDADPAEKPKTLPELQQLLSKAKAEIQFIESLFTADPPPDAADAALYRERLEYLAGALGALPKLIDQVTAMEAAAATPSAKRGYHSMEISPFFNLKRTSNGEHREPRSG